MIKSVYLHQICFSNVFVLFLLLVKSNFHKISAILIKKLLLSTLVETDEANRFERLIIVEFELYVHSRRQ